MRFISITLFHSSKLYSWGSFLIPIPALFTNMSMFSKVSMDLDIMLATELSSATSTFNPITLLPNVSSSFNASAVFISFLAAMTMLAPAAAIPLAIPSPKPPFPPVTIAVFPDRSNRFLGIYSSFCF